jgi:hypothetical protein
VSVIHREGLKNRTKRKINMGFSEGKIDKNLHKKAVI